MNSQNGRGRFWESPVFRRFIFSYLLIAALPLILIPTALYAANSETMRQRIYDTQLSSVMQARRSLDAEAQRYRTVAVMLANEQSMQSLIDVDAAGMRPAYALTFQRLRSLLGSTASGTDGTECIIIYMGKSGYAVDLARALPLEDVYAALIDSRLVGEGYDEFVGMVSRPYGGEWIATDAYGDRRVFFAATLKARYSDAKATMLVAMRKTFIDAMLRPLSPDGDEWAAVWSEGGSPLYQSGGAPAELLVGRMTGDRGQYTDDGWLISYAHSAVTTDVFVHAISERALLAPIARLRNLTYALLLACFAVCAVLTYSFAVRDLNPLRQLVSLARGGEGRDEYVVLRQKLIEASDEKRRLTDRSAMDERLRRDHDAYRRLYRCADWRSLETGGPGDGSCMARVVLIDYTEPCAPADAMALIRDAFDFAPGALWSSTAYQRGDSLLLLFRLRDPVAAALRDVQSALRTAVQLVRDNYSTDCLVGFSAVRRTEGPVPDKLHDMELETHAAIHDMPPGESIVQYREDTTLDRAYRRLLAEAARSDDPEPAIAAFAKEVRGLLRGTSAEGGANEPDESAEFRIKREVISIVAAQYADPSLNVSQIASELNRSADYVSKAFKQTTLIGLLDYIHHTRVKAAQKLLVSRPDLTIAEVGMAVGYVSVDSFIRACRRIMDMTPGKYRETATAPKTADAGAAHSVDRT